MDYCPGHYSRPGRVRPATGPISNRIFPAAAAAKQSKSTEKIRGPAVAGLFYPKHESDLAKQIDEYLAEAKAEPIKNLRALICPHAGYEFSGKIAASGYKQLQGRNFDTVMILGPSHYAAFTGAGVTDAEAYETPLGLVPISAKAAEIGKIKPFAINPPCEVQRPDFWHQSPKDLPAFGEDQFDTWEHSLEVQLPFLQRTLKKFSHRAGGFRRSRSRGRGKDAGEIPRRPHADSGQYRSEPLLSLRNSQEAG